jgi:hypothetical protein
VISNPPKDRMEKAAFVLDRAMRCPKTLRFRSFYNVKPRSTERGYLQTARRDFLIMK